MDMNADISDNCSLFANHMAQFCNDNHLYCEVRLPTDSYAYVSDAWHTTTWLDHCIITADAHASLGCMGILYGAATTDDLPFSMSINVDYLPALTSNGIKC